MQQAIENYIERNEVTFKLQAVNGDGEVLLQETSSLSFDDVSSYSYQLDAAFLKLVQESEEGKDDDIIDAEINKDLERGY